MSTPLFRVSPSVVPADKESTVVITSADGCFRFIDELTYDVTVTPRDEQDVPMGERTLLGYERYRTVQHLHPVDGKLHVTYFFGGEQEWTIHVSTAEYEPYQNPMYKAYGERYWRSRIHYPRAGVDLEVFSLGRELYGTLPLRGDLHMHTDVSDGIHTPALVAARCREVGYDFAAVTDHHVYNADAEAREQLSFVKGLQLLVGEEVHDGYVGEIHMVNIGSRYSVNDRYFNNAGEIATRVEALRGTVAVPDGVDETFWLHRVVVYEEIKNSGGLAIFPHPCWRLGTRHHVGAKAALAILKHRLCDAFEVVGGCSAEGNHLQVAMYHQMRAEGVNLPVVGSSDTHAVLGSDPHFAQLSTVVFCAPDRDVVAAVCAGNSVAVENVLGESVRVHGEFRKVRYTHFLLRNYFPLHDALCATAGSMLCEYVLGDTALQPCIEQYEQKVADLQREFFGL